MIVILTRVLDLSIGLLSVLAVWERMKPTPNSISTKDLLKMVEEKDREIERLTIQNHAVTLRHTNHLKTCTPRQ